MVEWRIHVRLIASPRHDTPKTNNHHPSYLATRQQEYSNLSRDTSSEWSSTLTHGRPSVAESASHALSPENPDVQAYITIIHGDVKSENLFSTRDGRAVAFYDFQYVGLGLGVCDLAKLFTCSVPVGILPAARGMGSAMARK